MEAQFVLRHIHSQETEVNLVIVSLLENIMEEVSDVLSDPSLNMYDRLKFVLINRVALTDQRKEQNLFCDIHLGNHKLLKCYGK
uniref:DUF7041 domain-containing protein n=1 Tax=Trichobilharzia regenti TaxID=157069 RepID=A0AA85JSD6_TRIRE|nr:unnamed protein product [Trichobilharzia regenti]